LCVISVQVLRVLEDDFIFTSSICGRAKNKDKRKEKFDLTIDFTLSYQDPNFNRQLCSLLDIEELPQKAVLIVVRSESDASSVASDDTVISPHARMPERAEIWTCIFRLPTFSFEVELVLAEGNAAYETTGKTLKLNRGQKHNILETLAEQMHGYKAYPNVKEISMVAEALVNKHPCLKEPGSCAGWYGWKNSLTFKMGNYRTKLSHAGSLEVAVNSGKRSKNNPQKDAPHTNIKRPKRAEINFLPNFPRGEDASSLEQQRQRIIDEVQMTDKNLIVCNELPVNEILKRWPALKLDSQFHRVTNVNLKNRFFAQLDQHTPRLQSLFQKEASRTGKASELLDLLFRIYDLQVSWLQFLIDVSFFKMWDQSDEPNINDVPLGLLLSYQTSSDAHFFCPERIAVLIEGNTVIESSTLSDAFIILFALTYTPHLNYPKQLHNTYDFVQKVLMGLEDGKLRPRVLSLKNDLLAVV
uniref:Uncharacterized protein n=1 Tax=Cyprinus carpio TaxID=7962 RepID=A0A8C2AVQ4_CYPCA